MSDARKPNGRSSRSPARSRGPAEAKKRETKPVATDRALPNRISQTSQWMQLAANACTVIALALLLVQMRSDARAERVSNSLSYVQQFGEGAISEHWDNLELMWLGHQDKLEEINNDQGLARANIDRFVNFVIDQHNQEEGSTDPKISIYRVAIFFDNLLICVEQDICEEDIVDDYFGQSLELFWRNYQTIILDFRRAGSINIGSHMEAYLESRS